MDRIFERTEWKPEATTGKHSQSALGLLAEVPPMQVLGRPLIQGVTFNGCLNESLRYLGMEDQEVAEKIHISNGYMSRFLRGVGQQWAKRLIAFMRVTHSLAPLQWMADQMGCDLVVRSSQAAELAAARARVQELERGERYAA
jgi:transcriptional regulator with XRE-family HTH domain